MSVVCSIALKLQIWFYTKMSDISPECEADWLYHEGHCYQMSTDLKNQPAAVAQCIAKKAQLVTAKTKDANDFLNSLSYW